jgi:DNA-binding CsgD family transcriptional regulator
MVREADLLRASNSIVSYIEKYVTCVTNDNRDEVLKMFDNMHRLFPHWVIATCPIMHRDLKYVSKNVEPVLGYTGDYMFTNSPMDRYFSLIHEADQKDMFECASMSHDIMQSILPEDHYSHRFTYHYRFRKANGQYIYMLDEKAVLNLHGSGNLYYVLLRDITAEKPFNGVKVEIYRQDEDNVTRKINEYKPSSTRNPLSKREKELVVLMKQGLSTKEIASHLSISHNTVRNIKSKLFEKYNVNNAIELLNMTG